MKLVVSICCLFLSVSLQAQTLVEKRISVSIQDQALEEAMEIMAQQGTFSFAFNTDAVGVDDRITYSAKEKAIGAILDSIIPDELEWISRGSYIILQKQYKLKRPSAKKEIRLAGTITDANTGEKIEDVSIYEVNDLRASLSDQRGIFDITLKSKSTAPLIHVVKENYIDTLIRLDTKNIDNDYTIKLRPKINLIKKVKGAIEKIDGLKLSGAFDGLFVRERLKRHVRNVEYTGERPLQLTLVPPIGTNHELGGTVTNRLSLNLIAGYAYGLRGLELGGVINAIRTNTQGVQMAGFGNLVGGDGSGIQMAGFMNINKGNFNGYSAAGFMNTVVDFRGILMAGFSNTVTGKAEGLLMAGFMNTVTDSLNGTQISGFMSSAKAGKGNQVSGFMNKVEGKFQGNQVSGFINKAEEIHGVQFGIINICDSMASGVPFGLFSYVKKGFHKVELAYSDIAPYTLSFRSGVTNLYSIILGRVDPHVHDIWSFGLGFGHQWQLGKKDAYANLEVTTEQVSQRDKWTNKLNLLNRIQLTAGFPLFKGISMNAGPVFNLYIRSRDVTGVQNFDGLNSRSFFSENRGKNHLDMTVGYKIAIRF